ncbi:hypothetical protein HY993_03965 [Candidatus Micrarchaeota archaeon]|nr:hypothetical protein [Candidatus Micrarchaeota archaeon]
MNEKDFKKIDELVAKESSRPLPGKRKTVFACPFCKSESIKELSSYSAGITPSVYSCSKCIESFSTPLEKTRT